MDGYIKQCLRNDEDSFVNSYVKSFGPQYDAEQLQYLLRDLLIAGSETTMTSLLWSLIYLANYPEWQARLQNQVGPCNCEIHAFNERLLLMSHRVFSIDVALFSLHADHATINAKCAEIMRLIHMPVGIEHWGSV
jgi:cytochrome P450